MSEKSFRFIIIVVVAIWVVFVLIPAGIDALPRVWASLQYFIPGDTPLVVVTVREARTGDGVADARVEIVSGQDVLTAATDEKGQAIFESVPAGYGRTVRVQKLDYDIETVASAVIPRRQRASFKVALTFDPFERLYIGNAAGTGTIDISVLDQASRMVVAPPGATSQWQSVPAIDMLVSSSTQRAYVLASDRVSAVNLNDGNVVRDLRIDPPAGGIALSLNSELLYIFAGGPAGQSQRQPTAQPTPRPTAPPRIQTPLPSLRATPPARQSPTPSPFGRADQQARSVMVLDTHTWALRTAFDILSSSERAVLLPSRDGQRLYVAGIDDQNIYSYDAKSYQRLAIYRLSGRLKDMTLDLAGRVLYVLLEGRPAPVSVDVTSNAGAVPVIEASAAAGLDGATKIVYAESSVTRSLCLMNPATDQISMIDVNPSDIKARTVQVVQVGDNPSTMVQIPASDYLLVANKGSSTLSLVSITGHSLADTISVHSSPVILAVP